MAKETVDKFPRLIHLFIPSKVNDRGQNHFHLTSKATFEKAEGKEEETGYFDLTHRFTSPRHSQIALPSSPHLSFRSFEDWSKTIFGSDDQKRKKIKEKTPDRNAEIQFCLFKPLLFCYLVIRAASAFNRFKFLWRSEVKGEKTRLSEVFFEKMEKSHAS